MKYAYRYHAESPSRGMEYLQLEHDRCVDLWDELVDIDDAIERRIEASACAHSLDTHFAVVDIQKLTRAIRSTDDATQRKPLIIARREARSRLWDGIKRWRRECKDAARSLEVERQSRVKKARQESPAWWPNYNYVVQRYEGARQGVKQFGRRLRHHDDLRDDGVVCIQIQRTRTGLGAAPAELFGGLSMVSLTPVDFSGSKKARFSMLSMRVDTDGNMIEVPVLLHRDFPPMCRIKQVLLTWRRSGKEIKWSVNFQLADIAASKPPKYQRSGKIDFCWEETGAGLVVARPSWGDPYILDCDWLGRMTRVSDERSLVQKQLKDSGLDVSEIRARTMSYEDVPAELRPWLRSWRKLWELAHHGRRKLIRRRNDRYHKWARDIVRECPDLEIDDTRLDKIARQRLDDGNLRAWAAVHILRATIIHQANKAGCRVTASGKVVTDTGDEQTGVWQRRKVAKLERSQTEAAGRMETGV